ncbi:hypothetical protein AHMF7605_07790 [Adhaeribacter arboris]|uniref:DUF3575 domain-containing protein n=1 Tax=Adhaeribacter arboris TaxID=2072846 RepID=A0A2T2YD56_9BACT|nr:hypothetical protein [Adhaeribacter arboris]PSR53434.1 hypothetical protein AHMF7605_07790 [Adhaeribacter arboris]
MKKILFLATWLFVSFPAILSAQEKVTIKTSEEEMDTTHFSNLVQTYNHLIRVQEEELQLFKIDLIGPALFLFSLGGNKDSVKSNVLRLAYERKIRPNWSWIVSPTLQADRDRVRDVGISGGLRYYYNQNNRILKGKSANNFSANYLGAYLNGRTRPGENQQQLSIDLVYGIQRRLGRWAFVDFDLGLRNKIKAYPATKNRIDLMTEIRLGLAF